MSTFAHVKIASRIRIRMVSFGLRVRVSYWIYRSASDSSRVIPQMMIYSNESVLVLF